MSERTPLPDKAVVAARQQAGGRRKAGLRAWLYRAAAFGLLLLGWQQLAMMYGNDLLLPPPWKVAVAFVQAMQDADILSNLQLTLRRVILGFSLALFIGGGLGLIMASFKPAMHLIDPLISPVRQVPVMAWVPLAIIWFGLGEGPTLFLITLVAVFPILLCTISGVQGVNKNFYHAARSMGSSRFSLFYKITIPAAMPELLTGMRAGVSAGWMSVI